MAAYLDAMEKGMGSQNEVAWKKKDGTEVKSRTILAPIVYEGHALALHFISKI